MEEDPAASGEAGRASADIPREWLEEFEAAAQRPLRERFRYAFIHTYKPVYWLRQRRGIGDRPDR